MVTRRKRKPPSLRKPSPRDLLYMSLLRQGGAIFDGCSTPQQKLERVRELLGSGRPSAFMRSLLKPITQEVYDTIALACTNAVIRRAEAHRSDRANILVKLPLTFRRYNKSFPKGILVDVLDIGTALFRYNANTLLDYLHKKGKVAYNSRMLRKSLGDVKRLLNNVDKQLDIDDIAGYDALTDEEMDMFLLKYGANGELVNVANKLVVRKLERLEKARIKREEKKDVNN